MKVKLTSPAEGKQPGETVDVSAARARWLIAEGYAVGNEEVDGITMTAVEPKDDPTLAENREAPGEEPKDKAKAESRPRSTPKAQGSAPADD